MTSPAHDPAWLRGTMTAVAVTSPKSVETVEIPIPGPLAGHALVRVSYAGLCGTDLELLHGTASYVLDGRTAFPHVVGHEWSGTVVSAPGTGLAPGQPVVGQTMVPCGGCAHCRGGRRGLCPHMREVGLYGIQGAAAEYVRMPASSLVPVPDTVDARSAALVEPAVTVVEAFRRAGCLTTDRVAVVGTGTIGLLAVQLAAHLAQHVDAVGIDGAALELATGLGARRGLLPAQADPGAYSLVIEASGASAGFARALDLVEPGGRVAAVGVTHEPIPQVDAARITLDGISLLGIRHGLDHYDETLGLFARDILRAAPLIHAELPATEARQAFRTLETGRGARPKILLSFGTPAAPEREEAHAG
ncbi:alcohol dehydrogenase catalytic domain-containing protein [Streptomyces sp. NBC_01335]|uniref:zinc-dependent alcohol dehydrogenase n=1 Tax=Streptomyces sp. NBC_01335 TaxID=2903828 RepID=UPI002E1230F1|nr:alcohol dehydrogenase catalytic domain-containing protein [Streptomyces sp. NBC_01335]